MAEPLQYLQPVEPDSDRTELRRACAWVRRLVEANPKLAVTVREEIRSVHRTAQEQSGPRPAWRDARKDLYLSTLLRSLVENTAARLGVTQSEVVCRALRIYFAVEADRTKRRAS